MAISDASHPADNGEFLSRRYCHMLLTIDAKAFSAALAECKRYAAGKRSSIPVLTHVHIAAAADVVTMTATDLECGVRLELPAEVTAEGTACVPVADLIAAFKGAKGKLEIAVSDGACTAAGFRIPIMDSASYPELPTAAMSREVAFLPMADLKYCIDRTAYAISQEESRFTLNGALVELGADGMRMVATDGHRLALAHRPGAYGEYRGIVRHFALGELAKVKHSGYVTIAQDENHQFFLMPGRLVIARKLTGSFPEYRRVLPSDESRPYVLTFSRSELLAVAERVVALTKKDRCKAFRMHLNGAIDITAGSDVKFTHRVEHYGFNGPETELIVSAEYLADLLKASTSDIAVLKLGTERYQGVVSQATVTQIDPGVTHVLMPMRG